MIHFLNITIQQKSDNDWRSFLDWADSTTMTRYQLRGYGSSPSEAADDAWTKYTQDRDFYIEEVMEWE